jgi:hypothetical protein
LTSALVGGEWSALRPGRFTPGERAPDAHSIGGWAHLEVPQPKYTLISNYYYYYYYIILSALKILKLYSLLTFLITKLTVALLWILLVSVYPLSKLETFPPLRSVMCQDLALQQGASRLQTTSENLWAFSVNITSPLRINFPLLIPAGLHHYRVTCIILLPSINV